MWVLSLGREDSPGGGHGNPLQYSCLENPMDRGAWQATVHRVTKSQTRLKRSGMCSTTSKLAMETKHLAGHTRPPSFMEVPLF